MRKWEVIKSTFTLLELNHTVVTYINKDTPANLKNILNNFYGTESATGRYEMDLENPLSALGFYNHLTAALANGQ